MEVTFKKGNRSNEANFQPIKINQETIDRRPYGKNLRNVLTTLKFIKINRACSMFN